MSKAIDMTNETFNGCIVLRRNGTNKDNKATWKCKCFCGNEFIAVGTHIRKDLKKSCGCLKEKTSREQGFRNKTHGETKTRLYNVWRGIKKRCYLPYNKSYKYYGAKGIKMCREWKESYESFRDWANRNGYEEKLTIDRIDYKGDYTPENCRWVDWYTQARNRSNNKRMIYKGENLTKSEVAERIGISRELLQYRIKNGIDIDKPKRNVKESDLG